MPSDAVRRVYLAAARDPALSERLWNEPEQVARDMGLRGVDVFEFVGSVRYGAAGLERARKKRVVLEDIALHRLGRPWPFSQLSTGDLAVRASLAQSFSEELYAAKGIGIDARDDPTLAGLAEWAMALREELRLRAGKCDSLDLALADALIHAENLVVAATSIARS